MDKKRKTGELAGRNGGAGQPMHLLAFDGDDLAIISTHLQDAIVRVADMAYLPRQRRFALVTSRFDWEAAGNGKLQRRLSGLHFDHVHAVKKSGFDQAKSDHILNLLSIAFETTNAPGGQITLLFSAGAAIRLEVECIDSQLNDMTGVWRTRKQPDHKLPPDQNLQEKSNPSK